MSQPDQVKAIFQAAQNNIVAALQRFESEHVFREDCWQHHSGGGGRSMVLEDGAVLEKAGVNFSHVIGEKLPPSASATRPHIAGKPFQAMGVSLVIHPRNPYVPTSHMNVRFFVADYASAEPIWWFGGGYDLTPYYGFVEDCQHWHQTAKTTCDKYSPEYYPRFKQACDEYFYLPHRDEARGVGGIFFDDLNSPDFATVMGFTEAVAQSYVDAYVPIVEKRKDHEFSQREVDFQHYRRGRYVEFNLVHDRGTLFGLQSRGRTESILMSLPPQVSWRYRWEPAQSSPEAALYNDFLPAKDWLA